MEFSKMKKIRNDDQQSLPSATEARINGLKMGMQWVEEDAKFSNIEWSDCKFLWWIVEYNFWLESHVPPQKLAIGRGAA